MKKAIVLALIFFSYTTISFAQSPCNQKKGWGEWLPLGGDCPQQPCGTSISFKDGICDGKTICGYGLRWRWYNDRIVKGAYYKVTFQYRTCSGEIKSTEERFNLDQTGIIEGSGNYTSGLGYEVILPTFRSVYFDPQKTKAKELATSINTAISNFDAAYNQANTQLAKVQDPQKRQNLQTKLNNARTTFLQYKDQAQTQLNNGEGDAMATILSNIKDQQEQLKMIDLDIEMDSHPVKIKPDDGKPKIKANPAVLGDRAEVTTPKPQSAALTNAQAQKVQVFDQTANTVITQLQNMVNEKFDKDRQERQARYEVEKKQDEEKYQRDTRTGSNAGGGI